MPDDETRRFAAAFKALGDPTRQTILVMLDGRPHHVNEIVEQCDLSQPTISRHLAVLKNAGLVRDERQGQKVIYHLMPDAVISCCGGFVSRLACCGHDPQIIMIDKADTVCEVGGSSPHAIVSGAGGR
jgi:DNA-binding transcriptional ArsR family regulator